MLYKDHFSSYFTCNIRYDFCARIHVEDHVAHPNTTRTTGDMTVFIAVINVRTLPVRARDSGF